MRPERRLRGRNVPGERVATPARSLGPGILAESDKSREREGSALAVKKPFSLRCGCGLGAPTARAALEHMAVMQQAIEHGADGGDIAEQLAPVLDRTVGGEQRAEALVAAHDDFQQILGGGVRQLAHAEVVDDEQRHSGHRFHVLFARAVGDGVGQFIEQDVRFAIQHFVALLNGAWPMACAKWLLPVPPGPRNNASSRLPMNAAVARSKTRLRFIFGLKVKSKLSSVRSGSRKPACLRRRSSNRSVRRVSSSETRHEIRSMGAMASAWAWRRAGFEHCGHAAQAELAQRAFEFDKVHG